MATISILKVDSPVLNAVYDNNGLKKIVESFLTLVEKKFIDQKEEIENSVKSMFDDENNMFNPKIPDVLFKSSNVKEKSPLKEDDDEEDHP